MSGILDKRLSHVIISAETICAEDFSEFSTQF